MKKRFVTLLLVLTMALSLLPGTAWAEVYQGDFASGTSYSYDTNTQTLTISGKGVIPSNDSDSSPYATCGFPISDVKKVVIESGVRRIGKNAFHGFTSLTSVTIPNTVTDFSGSAFYGCHSLSTITLPNSLKTIGAYAFAYCYALKSITIPASVTEIRQAAFLHCENLKITFTSDVPKTPVERGPIMPNSATIYYPAGNATWTGMALMMLGAETWIPVCDGDHTLGEWTSVDETTHKRSCTYCDYEETADHGWDEGTVTTAPTCQATGEALFTCTVCAATRTETLPLGDHPYSDWVKVDENTHTHACTVCGTEETVAHTWDEGSVITAANCIAGGETMYTCTGCGLTRDEAVAMTGIHTYDHGCDKDCNVCGATRTTEHRYADDWTSGKAGHWHTCVNCGAKGTVADHVPGPEATEEAPQLCTVCDYILHPTLQHEHDYAAALTGDDTGHWYACASCSEQKDFAAHTFDNDCDTTCNACGYTRVTEHRWSDAWSHDESGHFHPCTVCGTKNDTATHDFRRGVCTVCAAEDPNYEPPTVPIVIGAAMCVGVAAAFFLLRKKKKKSAA